MTGKYFRKHCKMRCTRQLLAGHSHWQNIRHVKAAMDFKKAKIFMKHAQEITMLVTLLRGAGVVSPREAMQDPNVQAAVDRAKNVNMPKDKIEKALERGCGLAKDDVQKVLYEVRGFGGVGILLSCETDNRNRTSAQLRTLATNCGSSLASSGQISFAFDQKAVVRLSVVGQLHVENFSVEEIEELMTEVAVEVGGEDVRLVDGNWEIIAEKNEFGNIVNQLKRVLHQNEKLKKKVVLNEHASGIEFVPKADLEVDCVDDSLREKNLQFLEQLQGFPDTINIVHNMLIPE